MLKFLKITFMLLSAFIFAAEYAALDVNITIKCLMFIGIIFIGFFLVKNPHLVILKSDIEWIEMNPSVLKIIPLTVGVLFTVYYLFRFTMIFS